MFGDIQPDLTLEQNISNEFIPFNPLVSTIVRSYLPLSSSILFSMILLLDGSGKYEN